MRFTIDNLDDIGPRDHTHLIEAENKPVIQRSLNRAAEMTLALVAEGDEFRMPVLGARVKLQLADGSVLFTGHLAALPTSEYLGRGAKGEVCRYQLKAIGEEFLLDGKPIHQRLPLVGCTAGDVVKLLTQDAGAGIFDVSGIESSGPVAYFRTSPTRAWSEQVAELATRARSSYRVLDRCVSFGPVGAIQRTIDEQDPEFSPEALSIRNLGKTINDVLVVGRTEPAAFVKDYFLGDGYTLRFGLSETPLFGRASTLLEEEYKDATLRGEYWTTVAAEGALSIANGRLRLSTSQPAQITAAQKIEIGASVMLQHGDLEFTGSTDAIIGGLYDSGCDLVLADCVAGFKASPAAGGTTLQAIVNGSATGPTISTVSGRKYVLSTRIHADAAIRVRQHFLSSATPEGRGGEDVPANARLVLEVHEIDPANPATIAAPSMVLYDGLAPNVPSCCAYGLIVGSPLACEISYTRLRRLANVQVRSARPSQPDRTRLVGTSSEGGECSVSEAAVYFYASQPPAPNEAIVVSYWTGKRSMARLVDARSMDRERKLHDDGVRAAALEIVVPEPRTSRDCENAARALLDDSTGPAWAGDYEQWGDTFADQDIWPGEAVRVAIPTRNADFEAIIRQVRIEVRDLATDLAMVKMHFANDAAEPLAFISKPARATEALDLERLDVADERPTVPDLPQAEVKSIGSTAVMIDAGCMPVTAGGFEVRRNDAGWGMTSDRNLVGRFTTQTFTVPRLARVQDYWVRMYDDQNNYSQHSTLLHIDYPL